jgi:exopolysaccharide production protein ExoQ
MRLVAIVATIGCFGFIAQLFRREFTRPPRQSISWAPFAWMFIAGSRFVSSWLSLRGPSGVDAYSEGSPVDRAVFLVLIGWGVVVLVRRDIKWGSLLARNKWLVAYLLYCLSSVLWSDAPDVMIKRWIKDLGNPIMALVIMTEQQPYAALTTTLRRLAFLFIPLSALFIRYYPELGRGYSVGGGSSYSGVADQKNTLGLSCLVVGIGYLWSRLFLKRPFDWSEIALLTLWAWVVHMSNSATSQLCMFVAFTLLLCARLPAVARHPTRIITFATATLCVYMAADSMFQVKDSVLALMGRDDTLTNRTAVWDVVLPMQTSAWFGTGFMTFWNGDRMTRIWATLGPGINQAHNGYIEQYLNLGYVGVAFIILIAIASLWTLRRQLRTNYSGGILRLCVIITALLYNYTEASFYGINNMWVLFLLGSIDISHETVAHKEATAAPSSGRTVLVKPRRGTPPPLPAAAAAVAAKSLRPKNRIASAHGGGRWLVKSRMR